MEVCFDEWMRVLRDEYIQDFVLEGGAAVKFAVVKDDAMARRVASEVSGSAEAAGYLVAHVDAARTRVHLMQELFHAVARQIPWEKLARSVVARCYEELGYPAAGEDLRIATVAAQHGQEPGPVGKDIRAAVRGLLPLKSALARDFRYAMLWMCEEQLKMPGGSGPDSQLILEWLSGDLKLASAVKKLLIYGKIGRHNARAMLTSLGAWSRLAGGSGLAVTMDLRQLALAKRTETADGTQFYTLPAVMDAYEVVRQFIDATDDLVGVLGCIIAPPALFEDEKRGVKLYKALYERVWPDVRLRTRPNPLSSLVDLEAEYAHR